MFFFYASPTSAIYSLSLHDALPISGLNRCWTKICAELTSPQPAPSSAGGFLRPRWNSLPLPRRSEEHTSELQSRLHLVCRLLLEKKKNQKRIKNNHNKHTYDKLDSK